VVSASTGPLLTLGKRPGTQEGVLAPGLVWLGAENIAPTRIQSPDHQACGELLYLLHCSCVFHIVFYIEPDFKAQ
jgi:hypothetical protein